MNHSGIILKIRIPWARETQNNDQVPLLGLCDLSNLVPFGACVVSKANLSQIPLHPLHPPWGLSSFGESPIRGPDHSQAQMLLPSGKRHELDNSWWGDLGSGHFVQDILFIPCQVCDASEEYCGLVNNDVRKKSRKKPNERKGVITNSNLDLAQKNIDCIFKMLDAALAKS